MEKQLNTGSTHTEVIQDTPSTVSIEEKGANLAIDNQLEQDLTLRYVLTHHKSLVAWTFYWALCAIGWYVQMPTLICVLTRSGVSMHR